MSLHIHPLLLTFSDAEVEAKYKRYRTAATHVVLDWAFVYLNACLFTVFLVMEMLRDNNEAGVLAALAGVATYVLQFYLMKLDEGKTWRKNRDGLVIALKILRIAISAYGVPKWVPDPIQDHASMMKSLVVGSGSLINLWHAWGMPLLFRHHVWLQAPGVALMMLGPGCHVCRAAQTSEKSRELVHALWGKVDYFFASMSEIVPANRSMDLSNSPHTLLGCYELVGLAHVAFGLVLPSFVLWTYELQSRTVFGKELEQETGHPTRLDASWVPDGIRVAILLAMSMAASWLLIRSVLF